MTLVTCWEGGGDILHNCTLSSIYVSQPLQPWTSHKVPPMYRAMRGLLLTVFILAANVSQGVGGGE